MKTKFTIFLLVLLHGFGASVSQAQNAPQAFSLQQAIEYALQNQQRMKIAHNDTKIAKAKVGEIRSIGLPQINVGAEVGNNFEPMRNFFPAEFFGGKAGEYVPVQFTPNYTGQAAISASQLVFDGTYLVGLKAASTFTQLSKKALTQTEIEITEQVSKAYYGVLVSRERMKLLEQNLNRLDTLLKQTTEMYKNGFAEKLDVDRLQVAFNNLQVDQQRTDRLVVLSEDLLKFQMGLKQTEPILLTEQLSNVEVDMAKTNTEGFNYSNRIEYSILETQRDLALLDIKAKRAGYYPQLALNARYGWNTANNNFDAITKSGNWLNFGYVGLGINIPVFDGLRKSYQLQQAKLTLENTNAGLKLMEQGIDLELTQYSTNLSNNLKVLESQKRNLVLAEDIARVSKIKYQEGVGSNLEVITAETDLRAAQTNYYAALYDALISKVDLDKATGTLK
ncbi:TolC family protein [Adhaeribacter soli]|uniref:TolC family protein n=1 Tax=Adhaeribacter soli TaxID=2607655 RepID=A0A5N1IH90_9BACT|nr:TolC family protein [Adhaeribacter soli]KAA9325012.1 TolC family protein [Adhaeribacter soli]